MFSAVISEKLGIDSDEINLEIVGDTASEESSDEMLGNESENETGVVDVDGWKD
jgi:hypothetical protein